MNGLDSPLEALAFIPVNLGPLLSAAVYNLWAWLAVLTAAFSFWRLLSSSLKTPTPHIILPPPPPFQPTQTTSFKGKGTIEERENEEKEDVEVLTRGNSKKFFTVYYEEEVKNDDELDDHDDNENEDDEMDGGDEVEDEMINEYVVINKWGSTELAVEMRGGDFGWYSYQNRKVIDGSVVRLWEEERESCCGSPRSCRSRKSSVRC